MALLAAGAAGCNIAPPDGRGLDGAARQRSGSTAVLAEWNALRGDAYELDAIERTLGSPATAVDCPMDDLVQYSGTAIPYQGAIRINEAFRSRLELFERVAVEVATEIYGRPPRRVQHYGAFSCRASRNRTYRLSEHALGNALDVVGFDFGPASKQQIAERDIPRALRGRLQVRVAKHWDKTEETGAAAHALFLGELTRRLMDRGDVFRGFVGPGHPGHDDHLHFDMSPWRYVKL